MVGQLLGAVEVVDVDVGVVRGGAEVVLRAGAHRDRDYVVPGNMGNKLSPVIVSATPSQSFSLKEKKEPSYGREEEFVLRSCVDKVVWQFPLLLLSFSVKEKKERVFCLPRKCNYNFSPQESFAAGKKKQVCM